MNCSPGSGRPQTPTDRKSGKGHGKPLTYQGREVRDYTDLAERLSIPVREGAEEEHWVASFLIQTVALKLDGQDDYVQSLCIEFNAWARNAAEAAASRERLVGVLRAAGAADPVFGRTRE